ncbi:MAG: DUF2254 domain-containing protein [Anaerolineales bacterium]|nr:DUF2254 domain-containing protein [Anaerolineales bacterium]
MDKIRARPIHVQSNFFYLRQRFQEWSRGSLLFYPFVFMLGSIVLVMITRQVDIYLLVRTDVPRWWMAQASIGITISSLVASSVLSFLAIVFSISLVALQLANQQYSPRVISIFEDSNSTKVALSLFIATFVYSFLLLFEVLRTRFEQITIVSLLTDVVLIFACLIVFIVFMKSIMLMIRVTYIITIIAKNTREAIDDNLPPEGAYVECQAISLVQPIQVIRYACPRGTLYSRRYEHGVLKALDRSALVKIASNHKCVFRVLPQYGDYINEGDPIVEVYGESKVQPEQVLKAVYVAPERGVNQDPAYGVRMLVDIALQALSPAVNAPTTAHQVIGRLTNLLAFVAQRPPQTGAFADENNQLRLLQPVRTWEDCVELAFSEIIYYGKDYPQTRQSLTTVFDYLLENVPEANRPSVEEIKKELLD